MQNGASALYIAAQNGHRECVQALLGGGASVDICEKVDTVQLYAYCQQSCSVWMSTCESTCVQGVYHMELEPDADSFAG